MERETLAVVDASVVVKWFNLEEYSENAEELKERHLKGELILVSPVLMVFEVLNVLRYSPELGADDVRETLSGLLGIQVRLYPVEEWLSNAVSLAFERGMTVYDVSYAALANHLACLFYTADSKLLDRVGAANVRHIADS